MMFVGETRFSLYVPNSDAWLASNGTKISPEEYLSFLYDDERMAPRCDIFMNYTLPMLELAARGHDVRHVVHFSENLPDVYKNQLQEAEKRFAFLVLDEVPVGGSATNLAEFGRSLSEELDVVGRPYGQYRLDDDDVLSVDFFDQMTPFITPEHVGYVVTLAKGVTAIYHQGGFYMAREAVLPLHSKGHLGVVQWVGDEFRAPADSSHNKSDRFNPVILDSRKVSHLWVRSTTQDGALHQQGMDEDEQIRRMQNTINHLERIRQERVDEIFPLMKGHLFLHRVPGH